jgi:hypothetical protein
MVLLDGKIHSRGMDLYLLPDKKPLSTKLLCHNSVEVTWKLHIETSKYYSQIRGHVSLSVIANATTPNLFSKRHRTQPKITGNRTKLLWAKN